MISLIGSPDAYPSTLTRSGVSERDSLTDTTTSECDSLTDTTTFDRWTLTFETAIEQSPRHRFFGPAWRASSPPSNQVVLIAKPPRISVATLRRARSPYASEPPGCHRGPAALH